jgi:hypothetical protein
VIEIRFITLDEETDGIAVEHDGVEVWADGAPDSWAQYFRYYMPKGVPVRLSQATRPPEGDNAEAPPPAPARDLAPEEAAETGEALRDLHTWAGLSWREVAGGHATRDSVLADVAEMAARLDGLRKLLGGEGRE